jgi:biopolymer transport protein ExbD
MQRGYDLSIPEKAPDNQEVTPPSDQIVLMIEKDGRVLLNKDPVADESVRTKLEDLLRGRRDKTIFFQCDDAVVYSKAIAVMDSVRAAGGTVGLVTTEIRQAQ